jgi:hypothetical protein
MPARFAYTAGSERLHKILQKGAPGGGQYCAEAALEVPSRRRKQAIQMPLPSAATPTN